MGGRDADQDATRTDLILSAALYLVSRYAAAATQGHVCRRLAVSIQCHLEILAERTDASALVRETCALLAEEWRCALAQAENAPCGPALLALAGRAKRR
jgi:hypothetical protein